jgi:hypothetical protein
MHTMDSFNKASKITVTYLIKFINYNVEINDLMQLKDQRQKNAMLELPADID